MAIRPAGVVFVNNDLTSSVRDALVKQLHINEVIDGYVFDDRAAADPNYIDTVKLANLRIMVVRSFEELINRSLADVVIFVTHGLASVLENKFGPPGITTQVCRITWGKLCVFET
jgi:hypothetical protein